MSLTVFKLDPNKKKPEMDLIFLDQLLLTSFIIKSFLHIWLDENGNGFLLHAVKKKKRFL